MQLFNSKCGSVGYLESRHSMCGRGPQAGSPPIRWAILALGVVVACGDVASAARMKPATLERVKHATVMVFNAASRNSDGDTPLGSGSGYFINSTGLLITNNHVVDPGHKKDPATKWKLLNEYNLLVQTVIVDSGTDEQKEYKCELLYTNESADQALLQALNEDGEKLSTPDYLRFMPVSSLHERLEIVALGFPGGDSRRSSRDKHPIVNVVEGHVLEIPRTPAGRARMIYTDAELRAGNSGGPVVNNDGLLVGTLTLGVANEERRNYNALVPAALTREFVRAAFDLGKIPTRTDVTPFVDLLSGKSGRTEVPHFARSDKYDVLYYENGDRIYGRITTDSLNWKSEIGDLTVPLKSIAYVMTNDEGSSLFLEGGNRIRAGRIKSTFQFEPEGGSSSELEFANIKVVAIDTSRGGVQEVGDEVVVLDSDVCHLVLQKVEGAVQFTSRGMTISVPVRDIARFDMNESDKRVLNLRDGRRLTGTFEPGPIQAVIAATQTPIGFDLSGVEWGTIEIIRFNPYDVPGLGLADLLTGAGDEIHEIAAGLESVDPSGAVKELSPLLEPSHYRGLPDATQEILDLLKAQMLLTQADYENAAKLYRKSTRAKDGNIAGYAMGCADLLKQFDRYEFNGKPLSDRKTFLAAGESMARDRIGDARDLLKDGANLEVKNRGVYKKYINGVKKLESSMTGSAVFAGVAADDELIRLWRSAFDVTQLELRRLNQALEEAGESSGRGNRRNLSSNRKTAELQKNIEETQETAQDYWRKMEEYGFRIEDPDLVAKRERGE